VGAKAKVEPTLVLAIMAIESSFNPFAQSHVGAQGLMQVMTSVHNDKYAAFGGNLAAFDPLTNLRVGVQVLRDCMARAGGDVELGLKYYVGAANLPNDGGYADKVLGEQAALLQVASGANVAPTAVTVRAGSPAVTTVAMTHVPAAQRVSAPAAEGAGGAPAAPPTAARMTSQVAPAAHAATGTVMAPAVGAALAANLSPSAAAPVAGDSPVTRSPAQSPAETRKTTAGESAILAPSAKADIKPAAAAQPASAPVHSVVLPKPVEAGSATNKLAWVATDSVR
jgi:hypothetical protein